ncbi:MAG: glycosyltransferase [Acidobacteriota bacterium]
MRRFNKFVVSAKIDYPLINPVPETETRPLFSVMITTYNGAALMERTLQSVLADDLGPELMQIEVVDDYSTKDDPEEVVKRVGKGRVSFYRQQKNVGISRNYTTCINRAKGHYVQILNGDDMVLPGFYATYQQFITDHPDVVMVFNRAIGIDENDNWITILHSVPNQEFTGIVQNPALEIFRDNFVVTSSNLVLRRAYEQVGGFSPYLSHAADWEMWMRITACGPVGFIHHPFFLYRFNTQGSTSTLMASTQNIEDALQALKMGVLRLPANLRKQAEILGLHSCACVARNCGRHLHTINNHFAGLRNTFLALQLHPSLLNLFFVIRSTLYCLKLKSLFS